MHVVSVGCALPAQRYPQEELTEAFVAAAALDAGGAARARRLHKAVRVEGRHLALPKERYPDLKGFGDASAAYLEAGLPLAEEAIRRGLEAAGRRPEEVDALMMVSVTGLAVPTVDARLVPRLGLRPDVKRLPIFGLGCVAGAAGLARLHDQLTGGPDRLAVLCALELCSLTLQPQDPSVAAVIAGGLFGDGAAAAVCVGGGAGQGLPEVVATRSRMYPDTEGVMGWDLGDGGFRIVLSAGIPELVRGQLRGEVDEFLGAHGLGRRDVGRWVCHPGGPKVLEALQEALELSAEDLAVTWESLARVGNLSSASVLFVLAEALRDPPPPGTWGLLMAMGPGFCSELVLLRW